MDLESILRFINKMDEADVKFLYLFMRALHKSNWYLSILYKISDSMREDKVSFEAYLRNGSHVVASLDMNLWKEAWSGLEVAIMSLDLADEGLKLLAFLPLYIASEKEYVPLEWRAAFLEMLPLGLKEALDLVKLLS